MMPLTMAQTGNCNLIKKINSKPEMKLHLESLGFVAGTVVTVIAKIGGNVIVNVKDTRVAISREMASEIYV